MKLAVRRAWLLGLFALGACPDASTSHPKGTCSKSYDKCVLANGVLGICDPVDCPDGQTPPCLICRSQH
jgi:hypothetical protein